jgi:hypothetical protein
VIDKRLPLWLWLGSPVRSVSVHAAWQAGLQAAGKDLAGVLLLLLLLLLLWLVLLPLPAAGAWWCPDAFVVCCG